jgi:glycosyltransferase involved in cell wall biosynthesis
MKVNFQDKRSPEVVKRLGKEYLNDPERQAGYVVARLTGAKVFLVDDGSESSIPDMTIEYANGDKGVIEVWTDTDEKHAALSKRLTELDGNYPMENKFTNLRQDWYITVSKTSNINKCEKQLPELLRRMEDHRSDFLNFTKTEELQGYPEELVEHLTKLQIVNLYSTNILTDKPTIRLYMQGISGHPKNYSWSTLLEYVEEKLFSKKLRTHLDKLGKSEATQRHFMFGLTDSTDGTLYFTLRELPNIHDLPDRDPKLPEEITHLWIFDAWRFSQVIGWFPSRGWFDCKYNWAQ